MAGQQVAYGQGVQLQHSSARFLSVKKNRAVQHKIAMVTNPVVLSVQFRVSVSGFTNRARGLVR